MYTNAKVDENSSVHVWNYMSKLISAQNKSVSFFYVDLVQMSLKLPSIVI